MANSNEICAIVVAYNREQLLIDCINSIMAQKKFLSDVLIIDNGNLHFDDILKEVHIESDNRKIIYLKQKENLGCAGGFNAGIQKALELGYRYLWLMDDDVVPNNDALYGFVKAAERLKDDWGCLSGVVYWKDGKLCKPNIQKKSVFRFMQSEDYNQEIVPVKMVSWASMFVRADVIKKVGLPISEYFIYSDDYEFSSRISQEYPVYVVTNSKALHVMEVNEKANIINADGDRLKRFFYLYRNDVHLYKRYGVVGFSYIIAKVIYTVLKIIFMEKNCKKKKIRIVFDSFSKGIHFKPKIEMTKLT